MKNMYKKNNPKIYKQKAFKIHKFPLFKIYKSYIFSVKIKINKHTFSTLKVNNISGEIEIIDFWLCFRIGI